MAAQFPQYSRSFFQKLIQSGHITVNTRPAKAGWKLRVDDEVTVRIPPPEITAMEPQNIPLDILYEDAHLLVLNKPAGMVVHPGAGVRQGTLVNALLYHCNDLSGVGGRLRPGIVHRLDKNTSGLLVVAKNDAAHLNLQKQFAEKTAYREYLALVWGNLSQPRGRLETYLERSKSNRKKFVVAKSGKVAITFYEVTARYDFLTLVKIQLKTGRTHQIRAHFQYLNHPVFGDPEYAGRQKQINRLNTLSERKRALYCLKIMNRQALHAYRLAFRHPVLQKEMEFTAALPEDFKTILQELQNS